MAKKRINCYGAGCDNCSQGIYVGQNFLGYDMYLCPIRKRKHLQRSAKRCKLFRCNSPKPKSELCKNCTKGK